MVIDNKIKQTQAICKQIACVYSVNSSNLKSLNAVLFNYSSPRLVLIKLSTDTAVFNYQNVKVDFKSTRVNANYFIAYFSVD